MDFGPNLNNILFIKGEKITRFCLPSREKNVLLITSGIIGYPI